MHNPELADFKKMCLMICHTFDKALAVLTLSRLMCWVLIS